MISVSLKDERGFVQGFAPSSATNIRNRERANLILSGIRTKPILEIGCGTGQITEFIGQVTAIDSSPKFINEAKRRCDKAELICSSFEEFETEQKFGTIIGSGILHHFANLDEALLKIRRLLLPNGQIVFCEPNLLNPYCFILFKFLRKLVKLEPQEMALTKKGVERKLKKAGFKNIHIEYKNFTLPITPASLIRLDNTMEKVLEKVLPIFSQSLLIEADI